MNRSVHKFGGSSLSSAARYHAVANIVVNQCQLGDVVVVSAAGKTTDTLVKLWDCYQNDDDKGVNDVINLIKNHQFELLDELLSEEYLSATKAIFSKEIADIQELSNSKTLFETALLAHGEIWSARLLAQYINQLGFKSKDYDARYLLTLNESGLDHDKNQINCAILKSNEYNVVTGFIASDDQGNTVTLGRNGSDYSATLIARYLNAESVSIWTDTQGVFSTDPRKVKSAIKYAKVCRDQANLLARLGNPVLHAKTLTPLKDTDIKLVVRSSFDSQSDATEIVKKGTAKQKRFLTSFENYDLIKTERLESGEIGELSQLIQHALHHFIDNNAHFLIVPAFYSHIVLNRLAHKANLIESNLFGLGIVCQKEQADLLTETAKALLLQNNVNIRFKHTNSDYGLLLCEQQLDTDLLTLLHNELIGAYQELAIVVAGLGNVGAVFLEQLERQFQRLNQFLPVKLVGLIRSKEMLFDDLGIDPLDWQEQWRKKAVPYEKDQLLTQLSALDYDHKVVIDITASEEFSLLYPDFAKHNAHLISANKYAGTANTRWYNELKNTLQERGLKWRYNTSVGAGLPINFALNDMQFSGDKITLLQGVFSGTLSWLCCKYDNSMAFSELLLQAKELGFTEPDPREDLSGRDVQRKLLILAREIGLSLDLENISLSPMMPEELASGDWQDFLQRKPLLDEFMSEQFLKAKENNQVLRYAAKLSVENDKVKAEVGLLFVDQEQALANLMPGDNIFVVNSLWYQDNALVIQGPGAGKEVTAAGIHSDLYWLVNSII